jgi:hypothetical protein
MTLQSQINTKQFVTTTNPYQIDKGPVDFADSGKSENPQYA